MSRFRILPALSVLLALTIFAYWYATTARVESTASSAAAPAAPRPAKTSETALEEADTLAGETGVVETPRAAASDAIAADASLSGLVRDQFGAGIEAIRIELHSLGLDGEEPVTHRSRSDARGEYRFDDLVAGRSYRLEVSPSADYAGFNLDSIVAEADGIQDITLQPIRLVDADGMIVDTNLAPIPNFTFRLRSLVVEFPERVVTSDSSGYFRLEGFPEGELRIATSNRDYYRIKGLALSADEYRTLTLVVDRGNYHLSGLVSDEFGSPQAGARVTIKSVFAEDGYHSFSYRSTLTDDNGAFEFAELGGNRYSLGVYAKGFESHIRNHEFQSFSDRVEIRLERATGQPE